MASGSVWLVWMEMTSEFEDMKHARQMHTTVRTDMEFSRWPGLEGGAGGSSLSQNSFETYPNPQS